MTRITRRMFIRALAVCTASLAMVAFAWQTAFVSFLRRAGARAVAIALSPAQRVRAHFSYLDLDPAGVDQFIADYGRYRQRLGRGHLLAPDVYLRYLLSTDFFRNGADESRRVYYVAFADPYVTPCNNPMATFES